MLRPPLAGWVGGKSQLAPAILERVPSHACYCEPFAGAAWVFFRKAPSRVEVLNDFNHDIANLYRVLKHHLEEFVRQFKWAICSREDWEHFIETSPEGLTDIHRAVRFWYLQKLSYGGKAPGAGATFGAAATSAPRLNLLRIEEDLSAAHLRLARVLVENLPYQELLQRYDKPETFFYIDPPYHGCEDYYGKNMFARCDFSRLASILASIKGRFLLSINDVPDIRTIFAGFRLEEVETKYSLASDEVTQVHELLISNYEPAPRSRSLLDAATWSEASA